MPSLLADALVIWSKGGWAMWALATVAILIFGLGVQLWMRLRSKGLRAEPEHIWRRWVDRPHERRGPIGELLDFVSGGRSIRQTGEFFEQLRGREATPFERDLRVMKICVGAAPLVGLLGTVTGMLSTFDALATGSGGDKTMAMIAAGISEALITTETGLVIALPGLFLQYHLARGLERYKAFLAHLETVCTQASYREERREQQLQVRRAARAYIAASLRGALQHATPRAATPIPQPTST